MLRKRASTLLVAVLLGLLLTLPAGALGDDVDYDSGGSGGGDSGGWTAGGDSGHDSGGTDSYVDTDSGSGSGRFSLGTMILLILIGSQLLLTRQRSRQFGAPPPERTPPEPTLEQQQLEASTLKRHDLGSLRRLEEQDPLFDRERVEATVKYWVFMLEREWQEMDMTPCRPYLSSRLFQQYQEQLEAMKQEGELPRTEDLSVQECTVESWVREEEEERLTLWLYEIKKTYKVDGGEHRLIVAGNRHTRYHLYYRWQLIRPLGTKTLGPGASCPGCGEPIRMEEGRTCPRCGHSFQGDCASWILDHVEKVRQINEK